VLLVEATVSLWAALPGRCGAITTVTDATSGEQRNQREGACSGEVAKLW
jgi:hypothetical protein